MARSRSLKNVLSLVNVEETSIEQEFLRDLRYSIEKEDEKNIHVASQTFKPSGLHCIRNCWFQLMGTEPDKESATMELIGICESGTDRHERLQNAIMQMKNNLIDCEYINVAEFVKEHNLNDLEIRESNSEYETKLYNKKYNISFLCDGIIRYNGKYYILEIKTETTGKFFPQKDVMPGHILQGTAYSLNFGIEDVLFLYENRDNCAKKTFMLHVTDEMRNDLVEMMTTCTSYANSSTCPPKPEDLERKYCAYCGYKTECARYI